jgi:hypothetical protein
MANARHRARPARNSILSQRIRKALPGKKHFSTERSWRLGYPPLDPLLMVEFGCPSLNLRHSILTDSSRFPHRCPIINDFRNLRSLFRYHSRLIAASRVSCRSVYSRNHTRPRVDRAPVPALCLAIRRSRSFVHPTYVRYPSTPQLPSTYTKQPASPFASGLALRLSSTSDNRIRGEFYGNR